MSYCLNPFCQKPHNNPEGINFCLSCAIKQSSAGTIILVRRGLYREGLVIDKPLEIIGDGLVADIIIQSTNSSCILMQTNHALVRGLTLKGCAGKKGKKFFAVDIPQGQLQLENCDITSDSLSCVAIHGFQTNPIISKCQIHDSKECGIYVYDNAQGTLENCHIFGNSYSGVEIRDDANPVIRQCQIYDGRKGGVLVCAYCQVILEDCDIYANAWAGVEIREGSNPTIKRCKITKNNHFGVYIHSQGRGSIENSVLTDNSHGACNIRLFSSLRRSGNRI